MAQKRKLLVGLGNPGVSYKATRHNVGFVIVEAFSREENFKLERRKFDSLWGKKDFDNTRVIVAKPLTYMNLSGKAIRKLIDALEIPLHNILVICDDVNLPLGTMRLRRTGSHGGHNGLRSIIEELGTSQFGRLRIGVGSEGRNNKGLSEYVLGRFTKAEAKQIEGIVPAANSVISAYVHYGYGKSLDSLSQYVQSTHNMSRERKEEAF